MARRSRAGRHVSQRGFTLLELLVVLIILGLALSALPAVIAAANPRLQLRASARALADELRLLREQAVTSHRAAGLTLDLADGRFLVGNKAHALALPRGAEASFEPPGVASPGAVARVLFFPDGSSTGGRVAFRYAGHESWVGADWLTGRITVHD